MYSKVKMTIISRCLRANVCLCVGIGCVVAPYWHCNYRPLLMSILGIVMKALGYWKLKPLWPEVLP